MNAVTRSFAGLAVLGCVVSGWAHSQLAKPDQESPVLSNLPKSGWSSFDVPSVTAAASWCCFDSQGEAQVCNLDSTNQGFSSPGARASSDGQNHHPMLRLFVRMQHGGQVSALRAYGAECAIKSTQPVRHFGTLNAMQTVPWLLEKSGEESLADQALAAIAGHQSPLADAALAELAAAGRRDSVRRKAIFWAGQLRGKAGLELALSSLKDADSDLRAHSLFVIAQSANANPLLARPAVEAIRRAVKTDADSSAREHAVFALSQLDGEYASSELIALLKDRSLDKALRHRALFWLAQSQDPSAQQYLQQALGAH